jgi:hypothetical protein
MNKFLKIILGIIATIILGAIGSGLWERMLGPLLDWITHATVGMYASLVSSYSDSIYEKAANGFHEENSLVLFTIFISFLPMSYYFLLKKHPTEKNDKSEPIGIFIRSRKGYWLILALTITVTLGTSFTSLKLRHINETITFSLTSIEIIRPHISEQKYLELRSRYYSMRTTKEFRAIYSEIVSVAKEHSQRLPDYSPL